ncbi:3-methylcrotonyl-CoA carboxylase beta subunit, partial [Rhodopseudomonas pseudopalustris]
MKSASEIRPIVPDVARNAETMRALVGELKDKLDNVAGAGGEASRA